MGEDLGCSRTYEGRLLGPEGREGGDGEGAGLTLRATPAERACRGENRDREVSQEGPVCVPGTQGHVDCGADVGTGVGDDTGPEPSSLPLVNVTMKVDQTQCQFFRLGTALEEKGSTQPSPSPVSSHSNVTSTLLPHSLSRSFDYATSAKKVQTQMLERQPSSSQPSSSLRRPHWVSEPLFPPSPLSRIQVKLEASGHSRNQTDLGSDPSSATSSVAV